MAFRLPLAVIFTSLLLHHASGHEEEEHETMSMVPSNATDPNFKSYFHHPHSTGWIYAHITLMIIAWVFILPVAIMLRIARSRFGGTSQFAFHVCNIVGLFIGSIYSATTPDLYSCNVHGLLGCVATLHALSSSAVYVFQRWRASEREDREFGSGSILAKIIKRFRAGLWGGFGGSSRDEYQRLRLGSYHDDEERSNSSVEDFEKHCPEHDSSSIETLIPEPAECTVRKDAKRSSKLCSISTATLDRSLLIVGSIVIVSGFVVYSGLFLGLEVYGGLSHWIKGGIFFWIGLLTLGRWIGAFADLGWAWNVKPLYTHDSWRSRIPSLEFVESFLIWLYGASNVFLEHLSNWGGEWSAVDFEHISITVLFFGGGLLGMVVDGRCRQKHLPSSRILRDGDEDSNEDAPMQQQPQGRGVSLNPIPSLTIGLLGLMMSNHHQHTALGAALHSQWGLLFFSGAFFRLLTLLNLYHSPPSTIPARPLTELITAFCLTGGGMLFMMSGRDSIAGLEANKIVAMTAFTGTMGLAAVVLAWEVVVFEVKVRSERFDGRRGALR